MIPSRTTPDDRAQRTQNELPKSGVRGSPKVLKLFGTHLTAIVFIGVLIFPLVYAIIVSTQTPTEYNQYPPNLMPGTGIVDNFSSAWQGANLGRVLTTSTLVAISVAVGKIILGITAAFAFVYFRFRGRNFFFVLILLTHLLPLPVRIVPTFELMADFGWTNTIKSLTVPFLASATGLLLFHQLYRTVPQSLADAARIDGAGPIQFLVRILIPLSKTNMAALFLIEFIYMWNQYLWPLIIANSESTRMIQIGLKQLVATDAAIQWGTVMAGVTIATIPPLIVLALLQRSLISGMALRGEK